MKQKIAGFLRRELLWFFLGAISSSIISYRFGQGDWVNRAGDWFPLVIITCSTISWLLARASAKSNPRHQDGESTISQQ